MKKISFLLSLVGASLTFTAVSAATSNQDEVVNLPAFRVTADRYTAAEKSVERSLAALRAQAHAAPVSTTLPSLNITVQPATPHAEPTLAKAAAVIAPART